MLGVLFLLCLTLYIIYFYWNVRRYPKGPFPFPLIGNLYHLRPSDLHKQFHSLGKQYDHCYTVFLPRPVVVFTDYSKIKEALVDNGDKFNGRSHLPPETILMKELQTGILFSDGEYWREQRRAALRILRDFGMGKNLMEAQVNRSISELLEQLESTNNGKTPYDMTLPLQLCVGNVINETLFGFHFKYNDTAKFEHFVKKIDYNLSAMRDNIWVYIINAFPWMNKIPFIGQWGFHNMKKSYYDFIEEEVEEAMKSYDSDHNPANFVHAYMLEMEKYPNSQLDKRNLIALCNDFWMAGMETTGTTLRWAILLLIKYPNVQDKMRSELLSVVGRVRQVEMGDKPRLPYCTATIHEIQRMANFIPFLGSHRCTEDAFISGKFIPKDTLTMPQIWSAVHEDEAFQDAEEFSPERFIEEDGKGMNKKLLERLIVFGMGKRQCAGEALARMELFLILAALLRKYKFEAVQPVDTVPSFSSILVPKPYKCRVVPL